MVTIDGAIDVWASRGAFAETLVLISDFTGTGVGDAGLTGLALTADAVLTAALFFAAGREAGALGAGGSTTAGSGDASEIGMCGGGAERNWTSASVADTRHDAPRTTTRPRRVISGFPVLQRGVVEPGSDTGICPPSMSFPPWPVASGWQPRPCHRFGAAGPLAGAKTVPGEKAADLARCQ
jgi:hypothetical protein